MKYLLSSLAIIWVIAISMMPPQSPENTQAYLAKDEIWQGFRKQCPFHIQTIGMTSKLSDGSFLMLASEPPPHANLKEVESVFKGFDVAIESSQPRPLGHDGWTKDLLIVVKKASPDEMDSLYCRLHRYLFFTNPRFDPLPLSDGKTNPDPVYFAKDKLNKQISNAALDKWLTGPEGLDFVRLGKNQKGEQLKIMQILQNQNFGIWRSTKPGLVAWVLPMEADLSKKQIEIRQFSEKTDLIVGAIRTNDAVAIIGQVRSVPESVLPMMRTETVLAIASVQDGQLGQSYVRDFLLAGRINGQYDWAPIYLSAELQNTDFGSQLNLADQMLKSWSLNGTVQYAEFEHQNPNAWPFAKPIDDMLHSHETQFNGNTIGAGQSVNYGQYLIMNANRTGALPVTYNPYDGSDADAYQDSVRQFENIAAQYFADLNSPIWASVARYAFLFQVFQACDIRAAVSTQPNSMPNAKALQTATKQLLKKVGSLTDEQIGDLALKCLIGRTVSKEAMSKAELACADSSLLVKHGFYLSVLQKQTSEKVEKYKLKPDAFSWGDPESARRGINELRQMIGGVRNDIMTFDSEDFEKLVQYFGDPAVKHGSKPSKFTEAEMGRVKKLEIKLQEFVSQPLLLNFLGLDLLSVQNAYVQQNKETNHPNWLKTPVTVVSLTKADTDAWVSGGHSLAKIPLYYELTQTERLVEIKQLPKKGKILMLNESAAARLTPDLTRNFTQDLRKANTPKEYAALESKMKRTLEKSPIVPVSKFEDEISPSHLRERYAAE